MAGCNLQSVVQKHFTCGPSTVATLLTISQMGLVFLIPLDQPPLVVFPRHDAPAHRVVSLAEAPAGSLRELAEISNSPSRDNL